MTVPTTLAETDRLNALADQITGGDSGQTEPYPILDLPPDGNIRLPGGYLAGLELDKVVYTAEVRELTGLDEERIEKSRRVQRIDRFLNAVLVAGVEKIGDQVATEEVLDGLLLGDRDYLMMEIRRVTYGDVIDYPTLVCPLCDKPMDISIPLDDIPIKRLERASQRYFDVPLKGGGVAECRLPVGSDQAFIFDQDTDTNAEVNNLLLSRCILAIKQKDGTREAVVGSLALVRNLGIQDRKAILEALTDKQPGPRYDEVIVKHDLCEKEVPFAVGIGDLFPGL